MELRAVRGMNDILPDEVVRWQRLEAAFRRHAELHGYAEVRTPLIEHTALFRRQVGETTDIVEKEMYSFERHGDDLTVRPEGTAGRGPRLRRAPGGDARSRSPAGTTSARCSAASGPAKGRYRQFYQAGCEIYGDPGPLADAEMIELVVGLFRELGVGEVVVHVNSLGSARHPRPLPRRAARPLLAPQGRAQRGLAAPPREEPAAHPRLQGPARPGGRRRAPPPSSTCSTTRDRAHWQGLLRYLDVLGVPYVVDPDAGARARLLHAHPLRGADARRPTWARRTRSAAAVATTPWSRAWAAPTSRPSASPSGWSASSSPCPRHAPRRPAGARCYLAPLTPAGAEQALAPRARAPRPRRPQRDRRPRRQAQDHARRAPSSRGRRPLRHPRRGARPRRRRREGPRRPHPGRAAPRRPPRASPIASARSKARARRRPTRIALSVLLRSPGRAARSLAALGHLARLPARGARRRAASAAAAWAARPAGGLGAARRRRPKKKATPRRCRGRDARRLQRRGGAVAPDPGAPAPAEPAGDPARVKERIGTDSRPTSADRPGTGARPTERDFYGPYYEEKSGKYRFRTLLPPLGRAEMPRRSRQHLRLLLQPPRQGARRRRRSSPSSGACATTRPTTTVVFPFMHREREATKDAARRATTTGSSPSPSRARAADGSGYFHVPPLLAYNAAQRQERPQRRRPDVLQVEGRPRLRPPHRRLDGHGPARPSTSTGRTRTASTRSSRRCSTIIATDELGDKSTNLWGPVLLQHSPEKEVVDVLPLF